MAFPHWKYTEIHCNRYDDSIRSWVASLILLPNSDINFSASHIVSHFTNVFSDPCWNGGHCTDGLGSYVCTCMQGFTGDSCQYGLDECASNPCYNGATCLDFVNAYTCKCAQGFSGVHCQNNDEDCTARYSFVMHSVFIRCWSIIFSSINCVILFVDRMSCSWAVVLLKVLIQLRNAVMFLCIILVIFHFSIPN